MRLLTRSDFDGLACATILKDIGIVDEVKFVHPKDLQDGNVEVSSNDVLANVPYAEGCGIWFDHHSSENNRLGEFEFEGLVEYIDSCAHVIYNYYKNQYDLSKFDEMIVAVDKVDSAKLTTDEIQNPEKWVLLGFIADPRTGLGRFREFTISNYQLMEELFEECRKKTIDEILDMPNVKERIEIYNEHKELFKEMLLNHTEVFGKVIVTDLRGVDTIYAGNRFMIYSLFPHQNISIWIVDGKDKTICSIAVGYSILNRTAVADVGEILLSYGGGGHKQVGTCQVNQEECKSVVKEIIEKLQ